MTREEAIERIEIIICEIDEWRCDLGEKYTERETADIEAYKLAIDALKTDVVRCEECKHKHSASCSPSQQDTLGFWHTPKRMKFCSDGERRAK